MKSMKKLWIPLLGMLIVATIIVLFLLYYGQSKKAAGRDFISASADGSKVELVEERSVLLKSGESKQLTVVDKTEVTFTSGNTEVATVDEKGVVKAVAKGSALITITTGKETSYCGVIVDGIGTIVDITSKKAEVLFRDMMLNAQTKIAGMGVDEADNAIYFSQSYGASAYLPENSDIIVTKVELQKNVWTRGAFMRFYESGEGHLDVENGKIWIESGGTYLGVGTKISCVDWQENGFVQESYGQTYDVGKLDGTKLAVDSENNMVAIYDSTNKQYLIYDKSGLKEGEGNVYLHAVVCAKDQTPVFGADDSQNHYNSSIRGFALADGYIYQISGGSNIYVSVFDLNGTLQYCEKIEDFTDMEMRIPAAIAVENGRIYLCVQSGTEACYFANVWKY